MQTQASGYKGPLRPAKGVKIGMNGKQGLTGNNLKRVQNRNQKNRKSSAYSPNRKGFKKTTLKNPKSSAFNTMQNQPVQSNNPGSFQMPGAAPFLGL